MKADDIPTDITHLVYTAPEIGGAATGIHSVSQNDMAKLLAHFWPAIEAHIRKHMADQLINRASLSANHLDDYTVEWATDQILMGGN